MLNAELKSMNSIPTLESLFSKNQVEEIASSVERFGGYANWRGSSVLGMLVLMLCMTSLSKHFIMIGVSAMGRLSFRKDTGDFFGTDMIVVDLRHVGMTAVCPCIFAVCEVIIDFLSI